MYAVKRTGQEMAWERDYSQAAWERDYSQAAVQMDSIAPFTIETGGKKGRVMWILINQHRHGDVMPSSCLVKRCYGIHL